ncbi:hypothetical protein [Haladaptatus sp. NG-SE-30]
MAGESLTLAAAQVEPVYHDKEATLDKACETVDSLPRRPRRSQQNTMSRSKPLKRLQTRSKSDVRLRVYYLF